jgi:hypothetical protein
LREYAYELKDLNRITKYESLIQSHGIKVRKESVLESMKGLAEDFVLQKTMYSYSAATKAKIAKEVGPLLGMFSRYPTQTIGEIMHRMKWDKNAGDMLYKYAAPWVYMTLVGKHVYGNIDEGEAERANMRAEALIGKGRNPERGTLLEAPLGWVGLTNNRRDDSPEWTRAIPPNLKPLADLLLSFGDASDTRTIKAITDLAGMTIPAFDILGVIYDDYFQNLVLGNKLDDDNKGFRQMFKEYVAAPISSTLKAPEKRIQEEHDEAIEALGNGLIGLPAE